MPFVSTPDSTVHYEVEGTGPGLVLVHGVGGDAERAFGNVVQPFRDRHTVIRPNLAGSGQSMDSAEQLSVELFAEQVAATAQAAAEGPVDLLGFSLGAAVAAATAATRPELVRRLILVGGLAHTTSPRDQFNFAFWRDLLTTDFTLFKRFAALQAFSTPLLNGFGHEGLAHALDDEWPPGLARQIDAAARVDVRGLLSRIEVPTLVIGFAGDQIAPIEGSRELHAGIGGSRLVEIEGEGHMDWFADPGQIVKLTQEFLA